MIWKIVLGIYVILTIGGVFGALNSYGLQRTLLIEKKKELEKYRGDNAC